MEIKLWDLDVPYKIETDTNSDGVDIIVIRPNSSMAERDENYNIVLNYDAAQELIRVLTFISEEIKPKYNKEEKVW